MKPHEVVAQLSSTTSRNAKEDILRKAWTMGCIDFFSGARYCYDKLVTFGVKKVPVHNGSQQSTADWTTFEAEVAKPLHLREKTGHAALETIWDFMEKVSSEEWNDFYRLVLMKDLNCGVSEKTINKVLESAAKSGDKHARDYLIPVFTCQLAHQGEKFPKKLTGEKMLDVKLDGARVLAVVNTHANKVTLHSRNGKINENFPKIEELLATLIPHLPESIVLDGEMISRSYQDLMTQFNRKENVNTDDAKFAVFDIIPLQQFLAGKSKFDQKIRRNAAKTLCELIPDERVYCIPWEVINLSTEEGQEAFKRFNREALEAEFEGVMVKDPNALYECKRSHAWLKLKPTITVDLQIIDTEAGEADTKYAHTLGKLICEGTDDASGRFIHVGVGSGLSDEQRDEFWANREALVGRTVEVLADTISQNQDGTYSLRFPRFVRFRDDK